MVNLYRKQKWIDFREEIIELDGEACVRCGKTRANGSVLQVHHKKYLSGKAPWEYPFELCETLCKGCHAEEHGEICPQSGWELVGEDDLGGLDGICERCNTEIRYVFHIQHPNWASMAVGTVCCDELTGTKEASDRRRYDDRLKRFYSSTRWIQDNNDYLIKQKQIEIRIMSNENNGYKIKMKDIVGTKTYTNIQDAKRRVFDFIESGEADDFFKNRT